jgi:hypothetical protein
MSDVQKKYSMIKDFITGKEVPDIGAEANRQAVERFLVEKKGYAKEDIEVDADIEILIAGEKYCSQVDLIVSAKEKRVMLFKCAAASLASREREAIAAARLFSDEYQIPFSVVSDGESAFVQDTHSGKKKREREWMPFHLWLRCWNF